MTTPSTMTKSQQSATAAWTLAPGQVRQLTTGPGERWLRVVEGRAWLTLPGSLDEPAEDLWLESGEGVVLPEGSELLIEGWPSARFQLLVPPQACAGQSLLKRLGARLASRPARRQSAWLAHAA
jgi:hypothetical protein